MFKGVKSRATQWTRIGRKSEIRGRVSFRGSLLFRINYDKLYDKSFQNFSFPITTRIVSSSSRHVRTTPMSMSNNRDSSINARGLLSRFIIHFISPRMHAQLFTNTPLFINPSEYCLYTSIYIRDPFMEHLRRRGGRGGGKKER